MIPAERFTNRVADYVSGRPGYPAATVRWLADAFALAPGVRFADVGSGTGISTELLLRHGFAVAAVEPNEAMREAAVARLRGHPEFRSVSGTAEATTLSAASVDAVLAAQAFHWFDAAKFRAECERILVPHGVIVLFWNIRRVDGSAFAAAYEALLREFGTDYLTVRHENVTPDDIVGFFRVPYERRVFENVQRLDRDGLRARLLSSSYVPAAGHPRQALMLAALEALFDEHQKDGRVAMEYELVAYAARI